MLCIPDGLREEDERLCMGFINNHDKYTHEQYLQKYASKEYLAWVNKIREHREKAWAEGRRI